MALLFLPLACVASGFVFYVFQDPVFAVVVGVGVAIWLLASYFRSAHGTSPAPADRLPAPPARSRLPSAETVRAGLAITRETIAVVDEIQLRRSRKPPPAPPKRVLAVRIKR